MAVSWLGCGETDIALLFTWHQEAWANAICTVLEYIWGGY